MTNSMWWYLTRASALTAWFFFTLTMVWGTLVSTRVVQRARARRWLLDLHPYLGGIGLAALVLHLVSLLMDAKAHIELHNLVVPFSTGYSRLGVALGVLGLWILLAVEATSMVKRWLPRRVWHGVHLFSYVAAWMMADPRRHHRHRPEGTGRGVGLAGPGGGDDTRHPAQGRGHRRRALHRRHPAAPAAPPRPSPPAPRRRLPRVAERARSWPGECRVG